MTSRKFTMVLFASIVSIFNRNTKKVRLKRNIEFLRICARDNVIPDGFILHKTVNIGYVSETFQEKWGNVLTCASREMRDLTLMESDCLHGEVNVKIRDEESCVVEKFGREQLREFENKPMQIGRLPDGAILVTIDVVGLYPHIPHEEGLLAIREALNKKISPDIPTERIVELAELVLKNNNFEFNGHHFLQK